MSADRLLGGLVALKAVDVIARGPLALPAALWLAVLAAWLLGAGALVSGRLLPARAAWALVGLSGIGFAVDLPLELVREHLVLLVAVALVAVVARTTGERLLLVRVQVSTLYGYAALAKVNASFLGGDVLTRAVIEAPAWSTILPPPPTVLLLAAGGAVIATEAALAVSPWVPRLRGPALGVGLVLHTSALVLVGDTPRVALRLVVFGGTAVVLLAVCAGLLRPPAESATKAAAGGAGRRCE